MCASSRPMVMMSRTRGMFLRCTGSSVSNAAAIAGSAEFFAPPICTVPSSRLPPSIRNRSIDCLIAPCCCSEPFLRRATCELEPAAVSTRRRRGASLRRLLGAFVERPPRQPRS